MVVDVLKKLKKDAVARQRKEQHVPRQNSQAASSVTPKAKTFEPAHKFFVSSNWKTLLERKPEIAPKAAAGEKSTPVGHAQSDGSAASNVVAIDCEMVGVGDDGVRSVLARVSIVDHEGKVLMDRFVRPKEFVTDFRKHITGITAGHLKRPDVISEDAARKMAADLLTGKVVVGHSVQNDFQALLLSHPHIMIRDTALFKPLRPPGQTRTPALKKLAEHWLQESIQTGQHDSVEDARIALRLYRLKSQFWEKQMRSAMKHHGGSAGSSLGAQSRPAGGDDDDDGESVERTPSAPAARQDKRNGIKKAAKSEALAGGANKRTIKKRHRDR
mmetsp:Transcript_99161/g.179111  ORF Transcript_99161/g.179111 Transcript_99161/m.179111 type:complete len:329 (+) Transcript_99161:91-1077(+)